MKSEFMILSLMIPGPNAPKKDMDVFIRPLVDELNELWKKGMKTRDVVNGLTFLMHTTMMWTIDDYPVYALMSRWSTKG